MVTQDSKYLNVRKFEKRRYGWLDGYEQNLRTGMLTRQKEIDILIQDTLLGIDLTLALNEIGHFNLIETITIQIVGEMSLPVASHPWMCDVSILGPNSQGIHVKV